MKITHKSPKRDRITAQIEMINSINNNVEEINELKVEDGKHADPTCTAINNPLFDSSAVDSIDYDVMTGFYDFLGNISDRLIPGDFIKCATGTIYKIDQVVVAPYDNDFVTKIKFTSDSPPDCGTYEWLFQIGIDATGSNATGLNTIASANSSHAEGLASVASGSYSHAEGINTVASGSGSHAEGLFTLASGSYSHAGGYGVDAENLPVAHGIASFNHQKVTSGIKKAAGTGSAILGGLNNSVAVSAYQSVVLGGEGQNAIRPNTVYLPAIKLQALIELPSGLDANDKGMIICDAMDSYKIKYWNGSAWIAM